MAGCLAGLWGDAVVEEEPPHEVDIIRVAVISVFYGIDSVLGAPFSLRSASLTYRPESGLGVIVRFIMRSEVVGVGVCKFCSMMGAAYRWLDWAAEG